MFIKETARRLKKEQGRETKWLADRCGVGPESMRFYLTGTRNPSLSVVKLMAIALGVDEKELWVNDASSNDNTPMKKSNAA